MLPGREAVATLAIPIILVMPMVASSARKAVDNISRMRLSMVLSFLS
jgi:hypothetical protein